MVTLEYLQETAERNVAVEERLEHIIDVMTDYDVAMYVPTNLISQWRYAPERNSVIAEKEYKDHYEGFDQWESYSIPVECLEMSDEELKTLFEAEADIQDQMQLDNTLEQLKRDAEYLGYDLVAKDNPGSLEDRQENYWGGHDLQEDTLGSPATQEDARDWAITMLEDGF